MSQDLSGKRIGPYEIVRELGRGGMGVVLEGRRPDLDRAVAIKMLLEPEADETTRRRFETETRTLARLNHPNVVGVLDSGFDRERPYLVMELIRGETLQERLRSGPLGVAEAVQTMASMARATHHAHELGVLHRDIKPDNVLLASDRPLLSDFGLARDEHFDRTRLTRTGSLLGTPNFMSPEQANGSVHKIDARSDVYSLGATLYAALTGRPPFDGDSVYSILQLVLAEPATKPSKLRPGIDRELDALCLRSLAKSRDQRHPSALALAEELEAWLSRSAPPSRSPAILAAAVIALGLVAAIVVLSQGSAPPTPAPTVSPTPTPTTKVTVATPTLDLASVSPPIRLAIAERRWESAQMLLDELQTAFPETGHVDLLRAKAVLSQELYIRTTELRTEAFDLARRAVERLPESVEAWTLVGRAASLLGDLPELERALARLEELDDASAETSYLRGLASWRRARAVRPHPKTVASETAYQETLEGDVIDALERAYALDRTSVWIASDLGTVIIEPIQVLNGIAGGRVTQLRALPPSDPRRRQLSESIDAARDRVRFLWARAIDHLRTAMETQPDPYLAHRLGWTLKGVQEWAVRDVDTEQALLESIEWHTRALDLEENFSLAYMERAYTGNMLADLRMRQTGVPDEALYAAVWEDFARAAEFDPRSSHIPWVEGIARRSAGQVSPAIDAFTRSIERSPDSYRARADRAGLLIREGRLAEAALDYRAILEREKPKDPGWLDIAQVARQALRQLGEDPADR